MTLKELKESKQIPNIGDSELFKIVGEMLGAQTGLGYMIIDSRNQLRIDILLAVIITIGIIGMLINLAFGVIEKQTSRRYGYDRD